MLPDRKRNEPRALNFVDFYANFVSKYPWSYFDEFY